MKNIRFNFLTFAAIVFGILLLSAGICDPDPEPDTLSVSGTQFTFNADDTKEETATVTTNVGSWEYSCQENWVNLHRENDVLRISVQNYNETENPRTAEIIVAAGTAESVKIKITQEARDNLSIDPEVLSFETDETEKSVSVKTNAPSWDATETPDVDWVNLSKQGNTLTVTVSPNTNTDGRSATIRITAGNADEKTLTVTQAKAHTLSVSKTSLSFEANANDETVTVTTTAPKWDAATSASWITLTKQDNKLKIEVSENNGAERKATVKITAGTAPEMTVTVTQKIHTLSVSPTSLSFGSSADYKNVTVTTTASSWDATASDSWVTLTKQGSTLRVNVSAKTTTSSRNATVRITAGTAPEKTVTVTQSGIPETLSVSPTSLSYGATETGTKTVTVTTNASSWNATTSVSWIQLTQQGSTLRVNVITTNSSASARSATIRVTAGSATEKTVTVTQAGVPSVPNPWPGPGNFTASGNATLVNLPASTISNPWSGRVTPYPTSGTPSYLSISNWGGVVDEYRCNYSNGKITINGSRLIAEGSGLKVYFKAIIIDNSRKEWQEITNYEVKYNSTTRVMDFSSRYNGYDVLVGAVFLDSNETLVGAITFSNAKLTMTSTSSTPAQPGDIDLKATTLPGSSEKENALTETLLRIKNAPSIIYKKAPSSVNSR
jgi:hypothetical protein